MNTSQHIHKNKWRYFLLLLVAVVLLSVLILGIPSQRHHREIQLAEADSLYASSHYYLQTSRFSEAYTALVGALHRYEETDNVRGATQSRIRLASLFFGMEQNDEARRMLTEAEPYLDQVEINSRITYNRICAIILTQLDREYAKAEQHMKRAIDLAWTIHDTTKVLADMGNLAEIYINDHNYSKALDVVDSISRMSASTSAIAHHAQMYLCKGRAFYEMGTIDSAWVALEESKRVAQELHFLNIEVDAMRLLAQIDSVRNDETSYISHYRNYIALRDTLNGSQTTYRLGQLKAKNKVVELQRDEQRRYYRLIILVVSLILLLTLTLSAATIFYLYYRRSRQNEVIARQEKEILNDKMQMSELEKELLQLRIEKGREKLSQTSEELVQANKDKLSMTLKLASTRPDEKRTSLKSFDEIFQKLDNHFFESLLSHFPNITKTEQRLACLIKLHMSTQEISSIMNVSSDSIYKMRYRLRKKLDLKPDEDLDNFISLIN